MVFTLLQISLIAEFYNFIFFGIDSDWFCGSILALSWEGDEFEWDFLFCHALFAWLFGEY